jgi:hypothetical protein
MNREDAELPMNVERVAGPFLALERALQIPEKQLAAYEAKLREGLARGLFDYIGSDRPLKWAVVELGPWLRSEYGPKAGVDNSDLPLVVASMACRAPDLRLIVELSSDEARQLAESGWNGKGAE